MADPFGSRPTAVYGWRTVLNALDPLAADRAAADGNGDGNVGNRRQPPAHAHDRLPRYGYREQGGCYA